MRSTWLIAVVAAVAAAGAYGAVIEPFAYDAGNLAGNNGGSGFSAAWAVPSGTHTVESGSLTPSATMRTGYATSGNSTRSATGAGSNLDWFASRALTTAINLGADSTTYFSFLAYGDWATLGNSRGFNVGFSPNSGNLTGGVTVKKDFNTQNLFAAVGGTNITGSPIKG